MEESDWHEFASIMGLFHENTTCLVAFDVGEGVKLMYQFNAVSSSDKLLPKPTHHDDAEAAAAVAEKAKSAIVKQEREAKELAAKQKEEDEKKAEEDAMKAKKAAQNAKRQESFWKEPKARPFLVFAPFASTSLSCFF